MGAMVSQVRLAACSVALALTLALLASCSPRVNDLSLRGSFDAAETDTKIDTETDGPSDGGLDGSSSGPDATADGELDVAPCVIGGTTETDPVTVACTSVTPARLAIGGDQVFWTVQTAGAVVQREARAGGSPQALVYDDAPAVGLAVDDQFVYYTQPSRGRVMRVPVGGGTAVALATGLDAPLFLTLDSTSATSRSGASLYWTGGAPTQGTIMKLALTDGAKPVTLVDGQTQPRAIAVAGGFVFWTDFADGTLLRTADHLDVPADGGVDAQNDAGADASPDASPDARLLTAVRLASNLLKPGDLVLVGSYAYIPDRAGRIARVPLAGGALESFIDMDDPKGAPFGITSDGLSLYWSTVGDGGIYKVPLGGPPGTPVPLALGEANPHFLAVDDVAVFWGTAPALGGAIRRIAK
jgi:hypothetical protein